LGFIAFVLGVAAEAMHTKADEVRMTQSGRCIYTHSPAFTMGVIATLTLMMAQIILNVAAGCLCCGTHAPYQSPLSTTIAIICLVLSWITFIIAFLLLSAGVALNDDHNEESYFSSNCSLKTGVFAGGAVLSLVAVTLGIAYYLVSSSVKSSAALMHQNRDIDMTRPWYGPSNAEPVFVPENIYAQYHENPQYYNGLERTTPSAGELQNSFWK